MATNASLLALLALAFVIGGLPFSVWIGRLAADVDVRSHGSRNPGASNVWNTVGRRYGILVGAFDAAKGAAMVWLSWSIGLDDARAVWVGAAAVVGHDFSPWLGFRGGKGGATTVGMLACFIFPELLIVLVIWVTAGWLFPRRRFVASIVSVSLCPLLALLSGRLEALPLLGSLPARSPSVIVAAVALMVLLWFRVTPGLVARRKA